MEDIPALADLLKAYNEAYRRGAPIVTDSEYDALTERLRRLDPDHPILQTIEPETFEGKIEVRHPSAMLSTEKAYTAEQLERFVLRVQKEASGIGVQSVDFKLTPKLDGLAGRDDGTIFASRGNGAVGYDITSAFDKGIVPIGGRGLGIGEIVMVKSYFDAHLAEEFEHPRNMVVGIVSSDTLNAFAAKALQDGMVHFVPYSRLEYWRGSAASLLENYEKIIRELTLRVDYPIDGAVAEVVNEDVKSYMGATSHHYRWQIAIKSKGETAVTEIVSIAWQVGRTGSITPVMEVMPVSLSGASIRRVTAHHAGLILKKEIGSGALIEIIRSGEVIPKLERVVRKAAEENVIVPSFCPSCGTALEWHNDFLKCRNHDCPAQTVQRIHHWFKTLGTADWFGIKTIEKLVDRGFDSLESIYGMDEQDFSGAGFGPVQSRNLAAAIQTSRTKAVEDWRFLAAFGISDLGKGDSRKLLSHVPIESLFDHTAEQIETIDGFGRITSHSIARGLSRMRALIRHMLSLSFNLDRTPLLSEVHALASPVSGKGIVFTGKMMTGTREQLQAQARKLGAKVQTAVTGKTDILVCGESVGAKKIEKARKLGARRMTEKEYLSMIQGGDTSSNP